MAGADKGEGPEAPEGKAPVAELTVHGVAGEGDVRSVCVLFHEGTSTSFALCTTRRLFSVYTLPDLTLCLSMRHTNPHAATAVHEVSVHANGKIVLIGDRFYAWEHIFGLLELNQSLGVEEVVRRGDQDLDTAKLWSLPAPESSAFSFDGSLVVHGDAEAPNVLRVRRVSSLGGEFEGQPTAVTLPGAVHGALVPSGDAHAVFCVFREGGGEEEAAGSVLARVALPSGEVGPSRRCPRFSDLGRSSSRFLVLRSIAPDCVEIVDPGTLQAVTTVRVPQLSVHDNVLLNASASLLLVQRSLWDVRMGVVLADVPEDEWLLALHAHGCITSKDKTLRNWQVNKRAFVFGSAAVARGAGRGSGEGEAAEEEAAAAAAGPLMCSDGRSVLVMVLGGVLGVHRLTNLISATGARFEIAPGVVSLCTDGNLVFLAYASEVVVLSTAGDAVGSIACSVKHVNTHPNNPLVFGFSPTTNTLHAWDKGTLKEVVQRSLQVPRRPAPDGGLGKTASAVLAKRQSVLLQVQPKKGCALVLSSEGAFVHVARQEDGKVDVHTLAADQRLESFGNDVFRGLLPIASVFGDDATYCVGGRGQEIERRNPGEFISTRSFQVPGTARHMATGPDEGLILCLTSLPGAHSHSAGSVLSLVKVESAAALPNRSRVSSAVSGGAGAPARALVPPGIADAPEGTQWQLMHFPEETLGCCLVSPEVLAVLGKQRVWLVHTFPSALRMRVDPVLHADTPSEAEPLLQGDDTAVHGIALGSTALWLQALWQQRAVGAMLTQSSAVLRLGVTFPALLRWTLDNCGEAAPAMVRTVLTAWVVTMQRHNDRRAQRAGAEKGWEVDFGDMGAPLFRMLLKVIRTAPDVAAGFFSEVPVVRLDAKDEALVFEVGASRDMERRSRTSIVAMGTNSLSERALWNRSQRFLDAIAGRVDAGATAATTGGGGGGVGDDGGGVGDGGSGGGGGGGVGGLSFGPAWLLKRASRGTGGLDSQRWRERAERWVVRRAVGSGVLGDYVVPFPSHGAPDDAGALKDDDLLVEAVRTDNHDFMRGVAVKAILVHRWNAFGRRMHLLKTMNFVLLLAMIVDLSLLDPSAATLAANGHVHALAVSALVLVSVTVSLLRAVQEWVYTKSSVGRFLRNPFNVAEIVRCVLAVLSVWAFFGRSENTFRELVAVLVYMQWFLLLRVVQPYRSFGAMVRMMVQIAVDIRHFLMVLIVAVVAVANALFVIANQDGEFATTYEALFKSFKMVLLADYDAADAGIDDSGRLWLFRALFVISIVVITIVLLNLLIATMSDSYERIQEQADVEFQMLRAEAVVAQQAHLPFLERVLRFVHSPGRWTRNNPVAWFLWHCARAVLWLYTAPMTYFGLHGQMQQDAYRPWVHVLLPHDIASEDMHASRQWLGVMHEVKRKVGEVNKELLRNSAKDELIRAEIKALRQSVADIEGALRALADRG